MSADQPTAQRSRGVIDGAELQMGLQARSSAPATNQASRGHPLADANLHNYFYLLRNSEAGTPNAAYLRLSFWHAMYSPLCSGQIDTASPSLAPSDYASRLENSGHFKGSPSSLLQSISAITS
jgi:hypothetical protein